MLRYSGYNSAVKGKTRKKATEPPKFDRSLVTAVRWDCGAEPMPELFRECDAIYIQPPWSQSFYKFDSSKTYEQFVEGAKRVISELAVPTVAIIGRRDVGLWDPDDTSETNYAWHGNYRAVLATWNMDGGMPGASDELEAAEKLISGHSTILDFMCGYGNTALWAQSMGRRCICADVSQECVDHINGNR